MTDTVYTNEGYDINLREPVQGMTFIEQLSVINDNQEDEIGGNYDTDVYTSASDAYDDLGISSVEFEVLPLAGVKKTNDGENIVLENDRIKLNGLFQRNKQGYEFVDVVNDERDVMWYDEVVKLLDENMIDKNGNRMPLRSLTLSGNKQKLMFQYPVETIDVHGEPVKHDLVGWTSISPKGKSGFVLWSTPLWCTNQIPYISMTASRSGNQTFMAYGKNRKVAFRDAVMHASEFATQASDNMKNMYDKMAGVPVDENDFEYMLTQVYTEPDRVLITAADTTTDYMDKHRRWLAARKKMKAYRNLVRETLHNGRGRMDSPVRSGFNLYSIIQAFSDVETRSPYNNAETATNQMISGKRRNTIAKAIDHAMVYMKRKGVNLG